MTAAVAAPGCRVHRACPQVPQGSSRVRALAEPARGRSRPQEGRGSHSRALPRPADGLQPGGLTGGPTGLKAVPSCGQIQSPGCTSCECVSRRAQAPLDACQLDEGGVQGPSVLLAESSGLKQLLDEGGLLLLQLGDALTLVRHLLESKRWSGPAWPPARAHFPAPYLGEKPVLLFQHEDGLLLPARG